MIEKNGYLYETTEGQDYCEECGKFLSDRELEGKCPDCGKVTRGDQCEFCMATFDADKMTDKVCRTCKKATVQRTNKHLMFRLSAFQKGIEEFAEKHGKEWRWNAVNETRKYLDQGLPDRAVTRDLDWGVEVPLPGYETKRVYVWFEAVLGYLTTCKKVCEERGIDFKEFMKKDSGLSAYYVHGKDNIPFHTIILPSLLLAHGDGLRLPDDIISSEYITLEGRKISTSQNWAVWAKDLAEEYNPDSIRYFFIANGPEKRDTDFSWREFKKQNNSELVGAWGNFVNRTLAFAVKYLNGEISDVTVDPDIIERVRLLYDSVGSKIEKGAFREALEDIFEGVRFGNTYYDAKQPWKTRVDNIDECKETIAVCTYLIANIANLLHPFLPFSSQKVSDWLGTTLQWKEQVVSVKDIPSNISILFSKIE